MNLLAVSTWLWVKPLWIVAVGVVAALILMQVFYFVLKLTAPKVAAIAYATTKESYHQPVFWFELIVGSVVLMVFALMPYNTFGDDLKVAKDTGLALIRWGSILLAAWSASISIADELEGRTALTVLSKPIHRRQFVIGKFIGVLGPVYYLLLGLGTVFLASISFKVVFDAGTFMSNTEASIQCRDAILSTAPGLVLVFLETMIMASIAVAISTRLPMIPNLLICMAIYLVGHLVPLLVQSSIGQLPIVSFMGQFLATILPVLDHFDIQAAIAAGREVPWQYLLWTAGYALLYSTVAMLLALVMFEDRDLA